MPVWAAIILIIGSVLTLGFLAWLSVAYRIFSDVRKEFRHAAREVHNRWEEP